MGRELKRVPLDFDWPLNKNWRGYLNPHWKPCPKEGTECFGGETAAGKWLDALTRLIAMLGSQAKEAPYAEQMKERGILYPHPYLEEWQQAPRQEIPSAVSKELREIDDHPTKMRRLHAYLQKNPPQLLPLTNELLQLVEGLAGQEISTMGGGGDSWAIAKKLRKVAKVPKSWGTCPVCEGHGIDPAARPNYEAWEREDPPEGDGFQLWQTTSEGSPVSPVFGTLEALCEWAEKNATTFGSFTATAAEWQQMLDNDFVYHKEGSNVFI